MGSYSSTKVIGIWGVSKEKLFGLLEKVKNSFKRLFEKFRVRKKPKYPIAYRVYLGLGGSPYELPEKRFDIEGAIKMVHHLLKKSDISGATLTHHTGIWKSDREGTIEIFLVDSNAFRFMMFEKLKNE